MWGWESHIVEPCLLVEHIIVLVGLDLSQRTSIFSMHKYRHV
jgi:hypothetical protein